MIPTVLLATAAAFLSGSLIALASYRLLDARGDAELERVVMFGSAFGLWQGLGDAYAFFAFPDWMLVYLQDGAQLYKPLAYLFFLFVLAASGASGSLSCGWFLARSHRNRAMAIAAAGLVALLSILRLSWNEYWVLGTREEFLHGLARPMTEAHNFQVASNVTQLLTWVPFLALVAWRFQAGRKVQGGSAQKT